MDDPLLQEHLKIKVVFLGKVAPLLKKTDRKYLETNIVEMRAFADIIFVKRFTRPQFWAPKIYAKKAEFAIKQVRDKIM